MKYTALYEHDDDLKVDLKCDGAQKSKIFSSKLTDHTAG